MIEVKPLLINSYCLAGLIIRCSIPLPELITTENPQNIVDVCITEGDVPESLSASNPAASSENWFESHGNSFLLKIPSIARYLVKDGSSIVFEKIGPGNYQQVRQFLFGSAFGALFLQRQYLPLHACVLSKDNHTIAFAGDSGAGKSTMAAWFHQAGYDLISDDVCVFKFNGDKEPLMYSTYPRIKLCRDAMYNFDIRTDECQQDTIRSDKYHVSIEDRFHRGPAKLDHLFFLQYGENTTIIPMSTGEAVHQLAVNTYRKEFIKIMKLQGVHLKNCTEIAKNTNIQVLERPKDFSLMLENQLQIERYILEN